MGEAGEWFASIEGPNLVIKGPTVEEEESLKSCFEAFAKDPNQNLFEVSFVPRSAAEAVKRWGSATKSFSDLRETQGLRCVHEIVYERHRNGTAVAVQGAGFKISYAELHQRAAAVCRAVREHRGAALMCMGRGEAIGPTFLGVLQSGSPMVPVDVAWPQERIKQSSLDADVGVALVEPSSLALLPELPCPTLVVDGAFYAKYAAEPDLCKAHEGDTALMLFTSGSTGKPKGIVLSHGYVTTLVAGITESKSMSPATKTLCYHSPRLSCDTVEPRIRGSASKPEAACPEDLDALLGQSLWSLGVWRHLPLFPGEREAHRALP